MEKQYQHKTAELQAQNKWETELTYAHENNPGQRYTIDTPPPTVSGTLHIGHIFSYTQTDIVARYKRMQGNSVFYPFGFDDNGLPTERFVEKKKKVNAHTIGRSEFINICLQETHEAEQQFKALWQRMGLSADWRHCYSTISAPVRKISQESFIRLYDKKYIYRREEPALYCTTCRTSVAQAELDSVEVASSFNDVVFKTQDGKELIVGTTRPELMASCVALLYHPDDSRYQHLKGTQVIVPVFNQSVPVYADELVDPEKGTGLVMVCTFGDSTDVLWFKKYNLPFIESIGRDGKFTQATGPLAGLKVGPAREKIIELLKEQNLLRNQKPITHTVNVHERCKKEIEYTVLKQWFLNILDHKQKFLELAETINWYPGFMKARYINWVENINWDWCLSRQRFYGIPFPVWHCVQCGEVILAKIDQLPVDPQETPYTQPCPKCESSDIVPDTDIMDTWNTSSLTPYLCYSLFNEHAESVFADPDVKTFIPMSMRPQAHDIIRTWAFYTIVKAWMHQETIPWNDIVISGHVLSDNKEKLSKSKGNKALSPENLLERYPADIIRYWTASGTLGHDTAFSETQMKIGSRLVTKLWNAFRFAHEHLADFNPSSLEATEYLGTVNEWILHNAHECFANYTKYLDEGYEFSLALDQIEKFFWHDFCDNYLEYIKDCLFNPDNYSAGHVHATHWTLYHTGLRILQLYAPYVPHVTETIYGLVYLQHVGIPSLHQTKFSDLQKPYDFADSVKKMDILIDVITKARKLKSEHQVSLKTPLKLIIIAGVDDVTYKTLSDHEALIKGVTQALEIQLQKEPIEPTTLQELDGQFSAIINL